MDERRKFPRVCVACPVQIRNLTAGSEQQFIRNSFVRNMSRVGIEFISFDFYAIDGRIKLQLISDRNIPLMDIMGRIVWVQQLPYQEKFRVGVQFLSGNDAAIGGERNFIVDEAAFDHVLSGAEGLHAN